MANFTVEQQGEMVHNMAVAVAVKALEMHRWQKRGLITQDEFSNTLAGHIGGVKIAIETLYGKHALTGLYSIQRACGFLTNGTEQQKEQAIEYLRGLQAISWD